MELLALPEARDDDLNVLTGVTDQALRHVENPNRFAHVQDEHFAALPDGSRLDDQLARLGDRQEKAGDIGVQHGNGAAPVNLLGEGVEHGTP